MNRLFYRQDLRSTHRICCSCRRVARTIRRRMAAMPVAKGASSRLAASFSFLLLIVLMISAALGRAVIIAIGLRLPAFRIDAFYPVGVLHNHECQDSEECYRDPENHQIMICHHASLPLSRPHISATNFARATSSTMSSVFIAGYWSISFFVTS
jgi:hypothetical protein